MNKNIRASCPECQKDLTHDFSNYLVFDLGNTLHSDANYQKCPKCHIPLIVTVSLRIDIESLAIENNDALNKLLKYILE